MNQNVILDIIVPMIEKFISEPIKPLTETCDTQSMAIGTQDYLGSLSGVKKRSQLLIPYTAGEPLDHAVTAAVNTMCAGTGLKSKPLNTEQ